jgi:hypothetical protein
VVDVVHALADPCFVFFVCHSSFGVINLNEHCVLWVFGFVFVNGHQTVPLYPYTAIVPPVTVPENGAIVKLEYEVAT